MDVEFIDFPKSINGREISEEKLNEMVEKLKKFASDNKEKVNPMVFNASTILYSTEEGSRQMSDDELIEIIWNKIKR